MGDGLVRSRRRPPPELTQKGLNRGRGHAQHRLAERPPVDVTGLLG